MSEPTSSNHPAGNLSAEGFHLRYTTAVSSEQQTSAFALTPERTGTLQLQGETLFNHIG